MNADELILQDFHEMCLKYNKKNSRGGSFSPFRYYKFNQGSNKPVYFIGGPGFSVAVVMTMIIALAFVLFAKNMGFWYWLLFFFFSVVALRVGLKIDKAKQIRSMAASLGIHAVSLVESALDADSDTEKYSLLTKSIEFLDESLKWVEEPLFEKQKNILEDYIKKGNPA